MKKLIDTFRRSFSARLSLWVVSFAALVFLAAMVYFSNTKNGDKMSPFFVLVQGLPYSPA